jgi:ParB family chromosome partitioning protein
MARIDILAQVADRTGTRDSANVALSIRDIPIGEIVIKSNIRREYEGINELVESIRQYGLLQPITVYKDGDEWSVKTGHRRFLAYKKLYEEYPDSYHSIRCIISDVRDVAIIQLIENIQRVDLSQLDLFDALNGLKEHGLSLKQIADIIGKNESYVKYIFTGMNEINGDPDLHSFIDTPGGTIQDVLETKGILDKNERLSLLEQRKEGVITRAELRKEAKRLKQPQSEAMDDEQSVASGQKESSQRFKARIACNENEHTIVISFEDGTNIACISSELKRLLGKHGIDCVDQEGQLHV